MALKYDKMTQREHILKRPGMYIGSIKPTKEPMWVYGKETIENKEIKYVPGLYKIFDEILVNARDHSVNDKTCNCIKVEVNIEEEYFSVYNNGDDGIPVVEHPKHKILVPSMIFGEFMTSSNYDDSKKRVTGGMNGQGGKLASVFSTSFEVDVQDKKNKKHFYQSWKENMTNISKAKVTSNSTKSYVKVKCYPDLAKFGIKSLKGHYNLFKKRVYDIACCSDKVKVYFNDEQCNVKDLKQYMDHFYPDLDKIMDTSNDMFKVGCMYFPDNGGENISYVNGICTYRGGTHVNHIVDNIIKTLVNDYIKKKNKEVKLNANFIKENLIFFIDSIIENPSFSSQVKETLTTKPNDFGSKYKINDTFMKKLAKCGIVEQVINLAKFKENQNLKKTDGRKSSVIRGIITLEDANKAGTKDSDKCSLILTEGLSAKSMVMAGLSVIGRNHYGVFPLKGKVLNVREASPQQIMKNEEISSLKKILGLRNDYTYESDEQFNTLRYGKIITLCDADVDGSHIKGLIMNLFHTMWPELIKREGFITSMNTPIVKATKGKNIESFYNMSDYEEWKSNNNDGKGWYIKYYKGLGTSDNKEAKEYFKDIKTSLIDYVWLNTEIEETEESETESKKTSKNKNKIKIKKIGPHTISDEAIELAFSKDLADKRKEWLINYNKDDILDYTSNKISIPDFIHKDLKHFSNDDTQRSIPSVIDGFKPSQRKIMYGAIKRGLKTDQVKVAQLAGFVSDRVAYHHGEASLMGAIIGMAQNFIGSNNINVLEPKGQFGSRYRAGKDHASPRYIWTKLEEITSIIYKEEDNPILTYVNDDGQSVEPEYFLPIIPMVLVNGAVGIGTGFSTNIPSFNPLQLINKIKELLEGKKIKKIHPWYRKFKGSITKLDKTSYQCRGNFNVDNKKNTIHITELPIGEWTDNYKEFLEKTLDNDSNIVNYINNCNNEDVDFLIKYKTLPKNIEDKFKLVKKINLTNLHGYTSKGNIQKFNQIDEIIMEYYGVRLDGYYRRKEYLLKIYKHELDLISYKVKFIKEIINKTLNINNKPKITIEKELKNKKYPEMSINMEKNNKSYDYLLGMNLYSLTKEKINSLEKQEKDKQTLYNNLKEKTPEKIWVEELDELSDYLKKDNNYKSN